MSDCCDEPSCKRPQPIFLTLNDVTGNWYAVTTWRRTEHGIEAKSKHNITQVMYDLFAQVPHDPNGDPCQWCGQPAAAVTHRRAGPPPQVSALDAAKVIVGAAGAKTDPRVLLNQPGIAAQVYRRALRVANPVDVETVRAAGEVLGLTADDETARRR